MQLGIDLRADLGPYVVEGGNDGLAEGEAVSTEEEGRTKGGELCGIERGLRADYVVHVGLGFR